MVEYINEEKDKFDYIYIFNEPIPMSFVKMYNFKWPRFEVDVDRFIITLKGFDKLKDYILWIYLEYMEQKKAKELLGDDL